MLCRFPVDYRTWFFGVAQSLLTGPVPVLHVIAIFAIYLKTFIIVTENDRTFLDINVLNEDVHFYHYKYSPKFVDFICFVINNMYTVICYVDIRNH
jgi:hypothetical protein